MIDPNYDMKLRFAEEWLRHPLAPMEAALTLCRGNVSNAIIIASHWIYDDIVLSHKEKMLAEYGEEYFLPSKATLVHHVWQRAQECPDIKEFVGAVKLIADMRGMIEKGGNVTVNTNVITNKVMNIPVLIAPNGQQAGIDDWERLAIEQQQKLTAD